MNKKINTKSEKMFDSNWVELKNKKEEFIRIVEVLNRYYSQNKPENYPSESHKFREKLLQSPLDSFKVFIKKFGLFEYIIAVEISENGSSRFDTWIHIDGIEEERNELKNSGILDHPIFQIVSMTDLVNQYCSQIETPNEKLDDFFQR
ncbi:MAG: hypothetical protein L6Q54_08145 [Leptospiraceae bacterium]|nr:hypothetical protein [Leptospiraceae bacterium]MCK6381205.1 hypothetical protein [Leptospiraceae bacterium]NUM42242.1 hypothetical protein [Leptospiraceae bacterium]